MGTIGHTIISASPSFSLRPALGHLPLVEGKSGFCLASVNLNMKTVTLTLEASDKGIDVLDQGPQRALADSGSEKGFQHVENWGTGGIVFMSEEIQIRFLG